MFFFLAVTAKKVINDATLALFLLILQRAWDDMVNAETRPRNSWPTYNNNTQTGKTLTQVPCICLSWHQISRPVSGRAASTLLLCLLSTVSVTTVHLSTFLYSRIPCCRRFDGKPRSYYDIHALVWLFPFVSGLSSPSLKFIVKHLPWFC
jgi:hypothetical protein